MQSIEKCKHSVGIQNPNNLYGLGVQHRLKEIRKDLSITQTQLAERCETSLQMVQYLENGQRQMTEKWLTKFSEALGVPIWHLLVDPKTLLDEFDRELASRFKAAPDDVKINIKRQLGMLEMPVYTQGDAPAMATVHDGQSRVKTNFEKTPAIKKGKR